MAGYNGFSMSNNAVAAYHKGMVPASKIKGVPTALVREYCRPREWHHSSKNFNRVDFYDPVEVRAIFGIEPHEDHPADPRAVAALANYGDATAEVLANCHVEWIEWTGSLKRPTGKAMVADGCTVSVKGQTATVTLPNGTVMVKRLTTRGFSYRQAKP